MPATPMWPTSSSSRRTSRRRCNNLKANHIELISDRVYAVSYPGAGNPAVYVSNVYQRANWQLEWTDADTTGVVADIINGGISTHMMIDNVTTSPTSRTRRGTGTSITEHALAR